MKNTVCILLCTLCTIFLIGCGNADYEAYVDVPEVISGGYSGACRIEVPQIMGSKTKEAQAINAEIKELSQTMQDTYMTEEYMWCEITALPTETERYLNLTLLLKELPDYGIRSQVMSWVYDKENGSQVTMDDALAMAGTDSETITADIAYWCSENGYLVTEDVLTSYAFRMIGENTPQFMASVVLVPESLAGQVEPWLFYFTWTSGEIVYSDLLPFDPSEVNGIYSNFLWCQSFEESMGQYGGDAAHVSEEEAMMLFEEIYEINKYLEDGYEIRFDGNTVEIEYETCICAVLGKEVNGEFVEEGYYAATWGSAYWYDPDGDAWIAVGFG